MTVKVESVIIDMAHNKENKYNYLQHSFDKQLQRSYDRNNNFSASSITSPSIRSPGKYKSPPRSSEFSPYENREENVKDKILVQQLKNHNRILAQQIQQYKNIIDKLHMELRLRVEQFSNLDILRQKEKLLHEQTIQEMRQEIGILLKKNTFLQDRTIVLEKQIKKYESQIAKNEVRNRSLTVVAASNKQTNDKLLQQINNILQSNPKNKKRDHGKLLNHSLSNINSRNHSPNNHSKNLPVESQPVIDQIELMVRKVQKYEELLESISEMHQKISGKKISHENGDLKMIWKWLKQLGHNYNITQKWKKMLIQVLGLPSARKGQQLSIDDVLQKTIVQLHSIQDSRK